MKLTQTNGTGASSTALTVDDSIYFYAGADAATWDLAYFNEVGDWIKIGSNDPVQITAINYTTHVITLASAQTWSDSDDIFLVAKDGITLLNNRGAWQESTLTATSTPSIDAITAVGVASAVVTADIFVREDGAGDHTTIQAALDVVAADEIIEIQANSFGGTQYFLEELDFPTNGADGTEIILRGHFGDKIIIYSTNASSGKILQLAGVEYWKYENLQLGRDETENGWNYSTVWPTGGRFAVEFFRWAEDTVGTSHHITFTDCVMYGGSSFDAALFVPDCHHYGFFNCIGLYSGINGAKEPLSNDTDTGGNILNYRGTEGIFEDCFFKWGGHDNISLRSPHIVVRRCIFDGDWSTYTLPMGETQSHNGDGNRAFTMVGGKGTAPYGPNLVEHNVMRNADEDIQGSDQSGGKFAAYRNIVRHNYIYDVATDEALQISAVVESAAQHQGFDEIYIYNNTIDNAQEAIDSTDVNSQTSGDDHYVDWRVKNNIFVVNEGRPGDDTHIRFTRNNSAKRGGDVDDWRGDEFENNIMFSTFYGGDFKSRVRGDGGSNDETTVALTEAEWPLVFFDNDIVAPTYKSQGNRNSALYVNAIAAFELDTGSAGLNAAVALTQANGSGASSTALTVDDSRFFYDGFDLAYFGESGDFIDVGGTIVQIDSIDYGTHIITLASAISWNNNDDVFLSDGTNTFTHQGAWQ